MVDSAKRTFRLRTLGARTFAPGWMRGVGEAVEQAYTPLRLVPIDSPNPRLHTIESPNPQFHKVTL